MKIILTNDEIVLKIISLKIFDFLFKKYRMIFLYQLNILGLIDKIYLKIYNSLGDKEFFCKHVILATSIDKDVIIYKVILQAILQ